MRELSHGPDGSDLGEKYVLVDIDPAYYPLILLRTSPLFYFGTNFATGTIFWGACHNRMAKQKQPVIESVEFYEA